MTRLELMRRARFLAHCTIDDVAELNDTRYRKLRGRKTAVEELALHYYDEAAEKIRRNIKGLVDD